MEKFKNIVIQLAEATSIFVDLWDLRLQVDEVIPLLTLLINILFRMMERLLI